MQNGSSTSLDLDLEQYLVPAPQTAVVYAANLAETPKFIKRGVFSKAEGSSNDTGVSVDRPATIKVITLLWSMICLCVCNYCIALNISEVCLIM